MESDKVDKNRFSSTTHVNNLHETHANTPKRHNSLSLSLSPSKSSKQIIHSVSLSLQPPQSPFSPPPQSLPPPPEPRRQTPRPRRRRSPYVWRVPTKTMAVTIGGARFFPLIWHWIPRSARLSPQGSRDWSDPGPRRAPRPMTIAICASRRRPRRGLWEYNEVVNNQKLKY